MQTPAEALENLPPEEHSNKRGTVATREVRFSAPLSRRAEKRTYRKRT